MHSYIISYKRDRTANEILYLNYCNLLKVWINYVSNQRIILTQNQAWKSLVITKVLCDAVTVIVLVVGFRAVQTPVFSLPAKKNSGSGRKF